MNKAFNHKGMYISIREEKYQNGRIALILMCENGPYAKLTCNLPNEELAPNEFFVKTYSENTEVAVSALKSGLFEDTGRRAKSGYVDIHVWRFKNG